MNKKESLEKIHKIVNPMHDEEPNNNDLEFLINAMGNYFSGSELEEFVNFLKNEL